jgi:hypothetical protein
MTADDGVEFFIARLRHHELAIYKTKAGRFVIAQYGHSSVCGELMRTRVKALPLGQPLDLSEIERTCNKAPQWMVAKLASEVGLVGLCEVVE